MTTLWITCGLRTLFFLTISIGQFHGKTRTQTTQLELLQTFWTIYPTNMPAYWTSSSSSSSLSSYSGGSTWQMQATDSMLMTFSKYLEQFETDDSYTDLMVTLFERQDLIIKTNEMKHLAGMVEHFQNEINHLQEYMQESFDTMEAGGLYQLSKKWFICREGVMVRQPELWFDLPSEDNRPSSLRRPLTPYPRDRVLSPRIKKPIHCLRYSPTASQYSPTASQYGTPPESPKPEPSSSRLSPTFIPEDHFPNLDFPPIIGIQETQEEFNQQIEEQYLEMSVDKVRNAEQIERFIGEEVQQLERRRVELANSRWEMGTWQNPIIIEDDWFRESLDVRGVMLRIFSSMNTCWTCFTHFRLITYMHCFMDIHFTWTTHFRFNMRITCFIFYMLLPCLLHEALLYIN